jgi:hypothetical protein
MQKIISVLLLAAVLSPAINFRVHAQETAPGEKVTEQAITNKDVTELLKSGLSAEIVVAKIRSSKTNFDTSPAALQELKTVGVPESVVLAMIQAGTPTTEQPKATVTKEIVVDDGTPVEIELLAEASSEKMKAGDIVNFKVVQPVIYKGVTIIDKDAVAKARITEAKKAGRWGKAGKLEWILQDVVSIDDGRIPLRFTQRTVGDSKGSTVAVAAVATTVLLGPLGLLWGLKKGKPVIIQPGNRYNVFVHGTPTVKGRVVAPN